MPAPVQGAPVLQLDALQILFLSVGLVGGLVVVTFLILRRVGAGAEVAAVLRDGSPLRMVTVASIVATVLVLSLAGRLDSQAAATILSGIAGYVLGGTQRAPRPVSSKGGPRAQPPA